MTNPARKTQLHFYVSAEEADLINERMKESGIVNLSAYLRKMAIDGYVIRLDTSSLSELVRLLRICSNNLNQYAKRANETGNIYASDIDDLRTRLDGLWNAANRLLSDLANIP